jgi:hypothetical protein
MLLTIGVQIVTERFTNEVWDCIVAVETAIARIVVGFYLFEWLGRNLTGILSLYRAITKIGRECLGTDIAE